MFNFQKGCGILGTILTYTTGRTKLWKLLIDHDMKKRDLEKAAQVSHYTMNKLTHGDNVTTDVLARICFALDADVGDIMEIIPDDKGETTHGA